MEKKKDVLPRIPGSGVCAQCGTPLDPGDFFCPACGRKAEVRTQTRSHKYIFLIVPAAILLMLIGLASLTIYHWVDNITLYDTEVSLHVGNKTFLLYDISPERNRAKKVTWSTSDEQVAFVDEDGYLEAVGAGECVITAKAGWKSDEVTVTVSPGPDFERLYWLYCDEMWATVGYDGSYLLIDDNPYDWDEYRDSEADAAIFIINDSLGLPDSLWIDMCQTSWSMGRQSETFGDVNVSWTYHPDRGLEVRYKYAEW